MGGEGGGGGSLPWGGGGVMGSLPLPWRGSLPLPWGRGGGVHGEGWPLPLPWRGHGGGPYHYHGGGREGGGVMERVPYILYLSGFINQLIFFVSRVVQNQLNEAAPAAVAGRESKQFSIRF